MIVRRATTEAWPAIVDALTELAQVAPAFAERAETAANDDSSRLDLGDTRAELEDLLAAMRQAVVEEQEALITNFDETNRARASALAPLAVSRRSSPR